MVIKKVLPQYIIVLEAKKWHELNLIFISVTDF